MRARIPFLRNYGTSRRGSVYVVVVAGLSLLGLITLTLSYTARMEERAAQNWSEGIQARIAAVTGVPDFDSDSNGAFGQSSSETSSGSIGGASLGTASDPRAPQLFSSSIQSDTSGGSARGFGSSYKTVTQLASTLSQIGLGASSTDAVPSGDRAAAMELLNRVGGKGVDASAFLKSGVAYHRIEDESAKFNLNAILDVEVDLTEADLDFLDAGADAELPSPIAAPSVRQFGAFIDEILASEGIENAPSGLSLARALVRFRYGPDGKPGLAGVDDNLNGDGVNVIADVAASEIGDLRMALNDPFMTPMNADGRDNDRDGEIDEPDESIETDGLDNDHDGQIDEPGEGVDEPGEFRADIRLKPVGDDRPFARLESLLQVPGFNETIVNALRPYVTVFSVSRSGSSPDALTRGRGGLVSLDPNTATPEEMFALLRAHYPSHPEELIGQYVANIVDRRDRDNVPSELTLGTLGETYTGLEVTPYINEVCPDVATFDEDGDDGQFVELFNPYTQDFDLTGWRLETGTSTVYLRGVLPGDGYLVITDDYDDRNDPEPEEEPGFGSLYDVFGVVATGLDRLVQEQMTFDLNNNQGTVKLYDNNDALVDSFSYTDGQFNGTPSSFQRVDPRVRYHVRDIATPFDANPGYSEPAPQEEAGLALFEALQNQPFRTPLELLLVSTSFSRVGELEASSPEWRFPSTRPGSSRNLDIKIVDLFQPGSPAPVRVPSAEAYAWANENLVDGADQVLSQLLAILERPPAFFGRLNVNTASPAVLAAIPGMGSQLAARIAALRGDPLILGDDFPDIEIVGSTVKDEPDDAAGEQEAEEASDEPEMLGEKIVLDEYGFAQLGFGTHRVLSQAIEANKEYEAQPDAWYIARSPQSQARWDSLSEFIRDRELWGDAALIERMERTYRFASMITFQSLAYSVKTANIPVAEGGEDSGRRSSVMFTERLLAADRQSLETVVFLYGHRVGDGRR